MNRERLRQQLVADEGMRRKPYRDTVGKLTIGVGRNLDDVGISELEALYLLDNDINGAVKDLAVAFSDWFQSLDPVRQAVLVNMCFNLGIVRLKGFHQTLAHVKRGEYDRAADQMLKSKWADQVGARASRLSQQMRRGEWA